MQQSVLCIRHGICINIGRINDDFKICFFNLGYVSKLDTGESGAAGE